MEPPGQALALHLLGNRGREELLALLQFSSHLGAKESSSVGPREGRQVTFRQGLEQKLKGPLMAWWTPSNLMSRGLHPTSCLGEGEG